MGKKLKGGRRQILQLEEKKPSKAPSKLKIKSLIHYSDSDDDSKKSNESEPSPSTALQNKDATPFESQIADFFKEIDALSVPEELSEEPDKATSSSKVEMVIQSSPEACSSDTAVDVSASANKDNDHSDTPSKDEAYCPWQEICDSSTGYSYYWNVHTNEVTWDCPPEYAAYIQSMNTNTETDTCTTQSDTHTEDKVKKTKKKNDLVVPEGAVIPISYFGNTSSSDNSGSENESSKCDHEINSAKVTDLKINKIVKKLVSKSTQNEEPGGIIGPSLPPNFHFPPTESVERETDIQMEVSRSEVQEFIEVGSSLSPKVSIHATEKPSQSDFDEFSTESSTHETACENTQKNRIQLNDRAGDDSPDSTVKKSFRPVVEYDSFTDEDEEICVSNISSSIPNKVEKSYEVKSASLQEQNNMTEYSVSSKVISVAENKISSFKRKASEAKEKTKMEELMKQPKGGDIDSLFACHSSYGKYGFGWQKSSDEQNDELCASSTQVYKIHKHQNKFKSVNFVKPNIPSSDPNEDGECCEVQSAIQQEKDNMTEQSTSIKLLAGAENEMNNFKRKASEALKEKAKMEELIKKPKRSGVDIDSLFASHSSYGKYGFGFGLKKPLDEQNDELCTSSQEYKTLKHQNEFKAVNFVKSNDVLNLKVLNDELICDETNSVAPNETVQANHECDNSNVLEHNEKPLLKNHEALKIPPSNENIKNSNHNDVGSSHIDSVKNKIDFYSLNMKKKNNKFPFTVGFISLKVEDDLEEIDRALCEALDAKKLAKSLTMKPSSPVSDVSTDHSNLLGSTTTTISVEKPAEAESADGNVTDVDAITDDILEISSDLIDKLTFLLSAPSTHASFSGVFFQLQTRFVDWQAGALGSDYFMARLKELEQYILHYEMSVISGEWTYQWDRDNKRYFYVNTRTQHSQWTYPEEPCNQDKSSWVQSQAEAGPSSASSFAAERDDLQTVSSSSSMHEKSPQKCSITSLSLESKDNSGTRWILQSSPPPPPPGVDSPPPPPPHTPPPESPPPPPPDSTETMREPEDMDIENSNDSSSFLFVNNASIGDDGRMQFMAMMEPSSKSSISFGNASIFNAVSSTSMSGYQDLITICKLSQPVSHSLDNSEINNVHWSRPSCSQVKINSSSAGNVSTNASVPVNAVEEKNHDICASSSNGVCSSQSDSLHLKAAKPGNSVSKKEKKKTKIQPGLGLKKKNIPSLVEKWQKIKEQQEKEDNEPENC